MEESSVTKIDVTDDIALICAQCKNCDPYFVYKTLDSIIPLNIKSGIIATSFIPGKDTKITFVVNEGMVISALRMLNKIDGVFCMVNGANSKISIRGKNLSDTEFTVKNILDPLYECGADIKHITTLPGEISLVVSQSKTDTFLKSISHLIN